MRRLEAVLTVMGILLGSASVHVCLRMGEVYMAGLLSGLTTALAVWFMLARVVPLLNALLDMWMDWLILYDTVADNPDRAEQVRQLAQYLTPAEFADAIQCIAEGEPFDDMDAPGPEHGGGDIFPDGDQSPLDGGGMDPGERAMLEHYRLYRQRGRRR
jgi:hypothetical protein